MELAVFDLETTLKATGSDPLLQSKLLWQQGLTKLGKPMANGLANSVPMYHISPALWAVIPHWVLMSFNHRKSRPAQILRQVLLHLLRGFILQGFKCSYGSGKNIDFSL